MASKKKDARPVITLQCNDCKDMVTAMTEKGKHVILEEAIRDFDSIGKVMCLPCAKKMGLMVRLTPFRKITKTWDVPNNITVMPKSNKWAPGQNLLTRFER